MTFPPVVLITTVDITPGVEDAFNRWYNERHLPEILACPGFVSAARYEAALGEPRFVAIYELESEDALKTPEMARVRGFGDMFPHVRNFHERVYRRVVEHSRPDAGEAHEGE